MSKEKQELLHIQVKDNGIELSHKIGNKLNDVTTTLETSIISNLISGSNTKSLTRYKIEQNIKLEAFKYNVDKLIDSTKKAVKTAFKSDDTVNLSNEQSNRMSKSINKSLVRLGNNATKTYQDTLNNIFLKVKSADDLKPQLEKHIKSGLNIGVVYKDGKAYKFDSYWEMKTRTDIQQDIGKNMVEAGHQGGVIFYIAAYFGDCAKDHVDYQGKIYCDPDWESIAPEDRKEEIRDYIKSNKIMSVKEVMGEPYYFTTRPNCRHYFQYVDIDSVLGAKTQKQVSNLRDKMDLNFNGKYQPDKYEALQKQRLNERLIREEKRKIEKDELSLHLEPSNKILQSKILAGEERVRRYQANQRVLERNFSNIKRSYERESLGNRVKFMTPNKNINNVESNSVEIFGSNANIVLTSKEIEFYKSNDRYDNIVNGYEVFKNMKKELKMPDKLKSLGFDGKVTFRKPTTQRDGSFEHIYRDHHKELTNDEKYLLKIKNTILQPDTCTHSEKNELRYYLDKYIETKPSKNGKIYDYWFKVIVDKEVDSNDFTVVTGYPYKVKKE